MSSHVLRFKPWHEVLSVAKQAGRGLNPGIHKL